MNQIHPQAIIHESAVLGNNCEIGPFCIIGPHVRLGNNNILFSNVLLDGHTTVGDGNKFFHGAVIGTLSQDLKDKGEPTRLEIGNNNSFREYCTVNRSANLEEPTTIGSNCLLMAYSHVAHNCQIGNGVIMANAVTLAGHVHIHDNVTIGGMTAISQFVRLGAQAFIGGKSGIDKDIPPYTRGVGLPYKVVGLNSVGLQRRGYSDEQIGAIKEIYKIFYRRGLNTSQAIEKVTELSELSAEQKIFLDFVQNSSRGICRNLER